MNTDTSGKLVVYSDYLCPFCHLGKASLEQYLQSMEFEPELEWRPFDIQGQKRGPDGELSGDDGKDEAYYERARRNVRRLSEEYGVEMEMDLAEDIDSWNAQKLALSVETRYDRSTFEALHDALFEALWTEGRDIGDPGILVDLAAEHDIPDDRVREVLASEKLDEELAAAFRDARQRGVRGIPTFIYGDRVMRGAVSPEQFDRFFDE